MSELLNHVEPDVVAEFDRLREDCAIVELPEIALVTLAGDDRKGWLQGQATNNLRSMDHGASSAFCLCEPTGQIVSVCDLWSVSDRFLLTLPTDTLEGFMRRVDQMVVLEDVVAEDVSDQFRLVSVQGPRATAMLSQLLALPSLDGGSAQFENVEVFALRSNRTGMGGWDIWIPASATKAIKKLCARFERVGVAAYHTARIEAGSPRSGHDYTRKTLPPELGPAFEARHVSYSKGCYTGQEVLMRLHSRGHANRSWVGLISEGPLEEGAAVSHRSRPDAGHVTSAAFSPDFGHIGAAMLRVEVAEPGESVTVATSQGPVQAEVRIMPILRLG
jgi:folate-binding protein YgfZ